MEDSNKQMKCTQLQAAEAASSGTFIKSERSFYFIDTCRTFRYGFPELRMPFNVYV